MDLINNRPKLGEKICYGFGDLGSCLFWQTITFYLSYFYTDVFGLAPAVAGTMFLISRIIDAFFDVFVGMAADRTETRWGKFRPYIIFGAVPLSVAAVAAFTTPALGEIGNVVYAYATFILFMCLYSTVNIPYTSLLSVISADADDRTQASSYKFVGAYLGGIIVSATALPLAAYFGGVEDGASKEAVIQAQQTGWSCTMIVYAFAAIACFAITFFAVKERVKPISEEKTTATKDLLDIVHNKPWILLFVVTILFILYNCIRLNVTTHYFKYYIGEQEVSWLTSILNIFRDTAVENEKFSFETLASIFNTTGQLLSLVGVLAVPWFSRILGRKRACVILMLVSIICTGSFIFFNPENMFLILLFQAIGSICGGPISSLLWVMYADTADYSEWKNGTRADGLVFSASIMSNKLGWAIGGMISMVILGATGFVANEVQNESTLFGLKAMMSIIPVIAGVIALFILKFFYKLDEETMEGIQSDLKVRREAANK
ncbi:MAG: MFS transporter [Bacteroidales bacterium]|nr:MFS transporter [Bacteroidales bacterium]